MNWIRLLNEEGGMSKTLILIGILALVLANVSYARGGGGVACYYNYEFHQKIDNGIFLNLTQTEINVEYLLMTKQCFGKGLYIKYNFGKVVYHQKAISGTHWY